jgi:hypothetical protein
MRKMLLVLILIVTCAITIEADENNLAGGVLIAHYVPRISVRYQQSPCDRYFNDPSAQIHDASEQVCRSDVISDYSWPDTWYVIAAFHEEKVWCGTQFGLGDYHPYAFYLTHSGSNCLANSLEIPTSGWPGPGEGISIAATDVPYEGNYIPIYAFQGYTYYGPSVPTLIEITEYPGQGFLGFGNCEAPSQAWPAEGGAMGFFMDGIAVYPVTPGACCLSDGTCEVMVETECDGEFHFDTTCDPTPCSNPLGACCFTDGICLPVLEAECLASGGDWLGGGTDCNPNLCPQPLRACCDESGVCTLTEQANCAGDWMPDEVSCEPNPCPVSPTENPSWGRIKTLYR